MPKPIEPHSISCRDVAGRERESTVAIQGRDAVLTVPPGEVARMDVRQVSEMIDVLTQVRDELDRTES